MFPLIFMGLQICGSLTEYFIMELCITNWKVLELQRTPFQLTIPPPTQMSAMEVKLVQEEVNKMLGKGAILEVEPWKDQQIIPGSKKRCMDPNSNQWPI